MKISFLLPTSQSLQMSWSLHLYHFPSLTLIQLKSKELNQSLAHLQRHHPLYLLYPIINHDNLQQIGSIVTRSESNSSRPRQFTDGTIPWPPPRAHLSTTSMIPETPTYFSVAQKYPEWRQAMSTEFNALLTNDTWSLVLNSKAANVISCKWVFRTKRLAHGKIERRKARLVAKCFFQKSGVDYDQTFSPVGKATTIRLVLSLAVNRGWKIKQFDEQNAFLHGPLSETMFMSQPPSFTHPQYLTHVCKLRKNIYGLKHSPRALLFMPKSETGWSWFLHILNWIIIICV